MENLIPGLVAALSAGAIAAGKNLGGTIVKDAYGAVKTLIADRYKKSSAAVDALEEEPESELEQQVLEKRLAAENAGKDAELAALTKTLLAALQDLKDDARAQGLLDFKKLVLKGNISVTDSDVDGPLLKAETATIEGDLTLRNIRQKN